MPENTGDRRQRKTREAVKNAVMELLSEKDVSKITARDIADRADINRSTFYLHYGDAHAVLESIESDAADNIVKLADAVHIKTLRRDLGDLFAAVTQRLAAYPGFIKYLISNKTGFYDRVESRLTKRFTTEYVEEYPAVSPAKAANTVSFAISGLFGAYAQWAERRDCTLEEFCSTVSGILENGLDL